MLRALRHIGLAYWTAATVFLGALAVVAVTIGGDDPIEAATVDRTRMLVEDWRAAVADLALLSTDRDTTATDIDTWSEGARAVAEIGYSEAVEHHGAGSDLAQAWIDARDITTDTANADLDDLSDLVLSAGNTGNDLALAL